MLLINFVPLQVKKQKLMASKNIMINDSNTKPYPNSHRELQTQIIAYYRHTYANKSKLLFEVNNNNKSQVLAIIKGRSGITPGVSDLILFSENGAVAIEIKWGKDTLKDAQKEFKKQIEENTKYVKYEIVKSLQDFKNIING